MSAAIENLPFRLRHNKECGHKMALASLSKDLTGIDCWRTYNSRLRRRVEGFDYSITSVLPLLGNIRSMCSFIQEYVGEEEKDYYKSYSYTVNCESKKYSETFLGHISLGLPAYHIYSVTALLKSVCVFTAAGIH